MIAPGVNARVPGVIGDEPAVRVGVIRWLGGIVLPITSESFRESD